MDASSWLPPTLTPERVIACIGLIADTHMPQRLAALPPALYTIFQDVDLLLHAGDVGKLYVLDQLSTLAPVIAVHGNLGFTNLHREDSLILMIRGDIGTNKQIGIRSTNHAFSTLY